MKEYFRIIFTEWDDTSMSNWDKWYKYSDRTIKILCVISIIVWSVALFLKVQSR